MDSVLAPDGLPMISTIGRNAEGVVDGHEDVQKPGEDGENFVGPDGLDRVRLPSSKRVCCRNVSSGYVEASRCSSYRSPLWTFWFARNLLDRFLDGWAFDSRVVQNVYAAVEGG